MLNPRMPHPVKYEVIYCKSGYICVGEIYNRYVVSLKTTRNSPMFMAVKNQIPRVCVKSRNRVFDTHVYCLTINNHFKSIPFTIIHNVHTII